MPSLSKAKVVSGTAADAGAITASAGFAGWFSGVGAPVMAGAGRPDDSILCGRGCGFGCIINQATMPAVQRETTIQEVRSMKDDQGGK